MTEPIRDPFADTSYWLALAHRPDVMHLRASQWTPHVVGTIITTTAVLMEAANSLSRPPARQRVIRLFDAIRQRDDILIIHVDAGLFDAGWRLYAARDDKSWSLVDCISFAVMEDHRLNDALTADHHFEQAGFRALLLEDPR